jgi:hypothetical protein
MVWSDKLGISIMIMIIRIGGEVKLLYEEVYEEVAKVKLRCGVRIYFLSFDAYLFLMYSCLLTQSI